MLKEIATWVCAASVPMLLAGCHAAASPPKVVAPPEPARSGGPTPPNAAHASTSLEGRHPIVSVWDGKVLLDGTVVGDTATVERMHHVQRVDGLFEGLKRIREQWKPERPRAPFPGIVALVLDRGTAAVLVKSVFQTAALAGYPRVRFMVRAEGGTEGHLDVSALGTVGAGFRIGTTEGDGRVLLLEVRRDGQTIAWRRGNETLSRTEVAPRADLAPRIASEWTKNGNHRKASDPWVDSAVVFVSDDVDYPMLIAAFDALAGIVRSFEREKEPAPALEIFFSMDPKAGPENPLARMGRLEPRIIQGIVRKNFGLFRACYERGLTKNPHLAGRVDVRFVIDRNGSVSSAKENDPDDDDPASEVTSQRSTLPDPETISCIVHAYKSLTFPPPEGGIVNVVYPIIFSPGE